jgi:WD40 repeat protein
MMPKVLNGIPPTWSNYKLLKGHDFAIQMVCFSPDGRKLVTCPTFGSLTLWDARTGARIGRDVDCIPTPRIKCLAFIPQIRRIVTGSGESDALLWDGDNGEFLKIRFKGHRDEVTALSVTGVGKHLVTGSKDKTIRIWSLDTNQAEGLPLRGHTTGIEHLNTSADGRYIASAGAGECALWRFEDRSLLHLFGQLHHKIRLLDFGHQNKFLFSGGDDGILAVIDIEQRDVHCTFRGHSSPIKVWTISADGKLAASGDFKGIICLWDLELMSQKGEALPFYHPIIRALAISKDKKKLISVGGDDTVVVIDLASGKLINGPFNGHDTMSTSCAISPDQTKVATGNISGGITLWTSLNDTTTNAVTSNISHLRSIRQLTLSNSTKLIASCADSDKIARIWDSRTGKSMGILDAHLVAVFFAVFSHDDKLVATGACDGTIGIWKVSDQTTCFPLLHGHTGRIRTLGFSADDTILVSGSDDTTLRLWNTKSGKTTSPPLEGHTSAVSVAVFLKSGQILSASEDSYTRKWTKTKKTMSSSVLISHTAPVPPEGIIVSSSETLLACAPKNNKIEVWRLQPELRLIGIAYRARAFQRGPFAFSDNEAYIWYDDEVYKLGERYVRGFNDIKLLT